MATPLRDTAYGEPVAGAQEEKCAAVGSANRSFDEIISVIHHPPTRGRPSCYQHNGSKASVHARYPEGSGAENHGYEERGNAARLEP